MQLPQSVVQFAAPFADRVFPFLGGLPPLDLLCQRFCRPLELLHHFRLGRLQFLNARLQPRLFSGRSFLLSLQLLTRLFEVLAQLFDLGFQFPPAFANPGHLVVGGFPAFGFVGQRFAQLLGVPLKFRLCRLEFLGLGFQFRLFRAGDLPLRLQLFLQCFGLFSQLSQLRFDFGALPANRGCLLLRAFPSLGLLGQRFGQPFELLLHFTLGRLQFRRLRLHLSFFGSRILLERL